MTITRRGALAAGAGALAAPALARAEGAVKTRICLLHGAWFGGWAWERVARRLRALGHPVSTPTLPGLGERRGEATAALGLAEHGAALLDHLFMRDLSDVAVVAHGYGGCVLSQVLAAGAPRIAQAIYFDAYLPGADEAYADFLPGPVRADIARAVQDGVPVPPQPRHAWAALWGIEGEAAAFAEPRLAPQPARTLLDPVTGDPFTRGIPRSYVRARATAGPAFDAAARRASERGDFRMAPFDGPHGSMLAAPDALAEAVSALVR